MSPAEARRQALIHRAKAVNADLQTIADRLRLIRKDDYPERFHITTTSFSDAIVGDFRQTVILLPGSVALLLFISFSNVASLLLVHTSARGKETLCAPCLAQLGAA